jgi:16S rRNA (adenine1518-N6/adenine1519-N6)-dimethyltransferase
MSLPPLDISNLLKRYGLRPDKRLGQNFLIDESALQRVAEAAEVTAEDVVLEIGPGLGSLTRVLAILARQVVAVEIDARFIPPLKEVLSSFKNVQLVQGDILSLNPAELIAKHTNAAGYLVVANIPYYITSALFRHLLETDVKPGRMVLTVQREVAERICAAPGDMSLLALSVQVYGQPQIAAHIPAGAFYPPPKVDSAVVRVDLYAQPQIPTSELATFFLLVKAGFSQKRKTLRNALSGGMRWETAFAAQILQAAGIDLMRRAETLSLEEWGNLVAAYQSELSVE